jgi:hypothetical protein
LSIDYRERERERGRYAEIIAGLRETLLGPKVLLKFKNTKNK